MSYLEDKVDVFIENRIKEISLRRAWLYDIKRTKKNRTRKERK